MRGLDRLDANGDSQITRAEAQTGAYPMFEKFDANKNGLLEKSELPKWGGS
jgi:hypothetical protein